MPLQNMANPETRSTPRAPQSIALTIDEIHSSWNYHPPQTRYTRVVFITRAWLSRQGRLLRWRVDRRALELSLKLDNFWI